MRRYTELRHVMKAFLGSGEPQWDFNKQNKLIELSNVKNKIESLSGGLE